MSRAWAVCGIILSVACLLWILRTPRQEVSRGGTVVDTSSLAAARDSNAADAARAWASFDSLKAWIDTAPPRDRWHVVSQLVHDTPKVAPGAPVDSNRLLRLLILDDSACHLERDTLGRALRLSGLRVGALREQVALLQQEERQGPQEAPDRPLALLGTLVVDGHSARVGALGVWHSGWLTGGFGAFVRTNGESPGFTVGVGVSF